MRIRWDKVLPIGLFLLIGIGIAWMGREETPAELEVPQAKVVFAKVYFIRSEPTEFYLEPVTIEIPGEEPYREVLEALLAGPPADSELFRPLPQVDLHGVEFWEGLVTVNLPMEIRRLSVGSRGEVLAVGSIVNTLTEFPEVQAVQLLIEGERAESLAGHIEIDEPWVRRPDLIWEGSE